MPLPTGSTCKNLILDMLFVIFLFLSTNSKCAYLNLFWAVLDDFPVLGIHSIRGTIHSCKLIPPCTYLSPPPGNLNLTLSFNV